MTPPTAEPSRITTAQDVARLAATILDPARTQPVVCLTSPPSSDDPLVDADALASDLSGVATVWVLPTGELSWEVTDRLPDRLDVYGGASRVWFPVGRERPEPTDHPLFLVYDRSRAQEMGERIVEALRARGFLETPEPVGAGSEHFAIVHRVTQHGVELSLPGSGRCYALADQITRHRLDPRRVLRPAQRVRVRVTAEERPGRAAQASLLPFEPESWQRIIDQYSDGMLVDGVVVALRKHGALVDLLPGFPGLVPVGKIVGGWLSHPEDALSVGDRVAVRITGTDPRDRRIDLTMLEIDEDEEPVPPASIYPDGPPWLLPVDEDEGDDEGEGEGEGAESEPVGPPVAETPIIEASTAELTPIEEPVTVAVLTRTTGDGGAERDLLAAGELTEEIHRIADGAERRVERAAARAGQIARDLERQLATARQRVLAFEHGDWNEVISGLEQQIRTAESEAADLKARLEAAEAERRQLVTERRTDRDRAREQARKLTSELAEENERAGKLERILRATGHDDASLFIEEMRQSWLDSTTPDDRDRHPFRSLALGPDFLDSVRRIEGVSRQKIVDVCAEVACGRAAEIPGRELHQLRVSESGNAPQRARDDGALAWRCNLQSSTAAARRLHYWVLPQGTVELGRVVYHDDVAI
jgi:hypothetical protein